MNTGICKRFNYLHKSCPIVGGVLLLHVAVGSKGFAAAFMLVFLNSGDEAHVTVHLAASLKSACCGCAPITVVFFLVIIGTVCLVFTAF